MTRSPRSRARCWNSTVSRASRWIRVHRDGVTCRVPVAALAFTGTDLTCIVEPGRVEFFAGTSSTDLHSAGHVTVTGTGPVAVIRPASSSTVVESIAEPSDRPD